MLRRLSLGLVTGSVAVLAMISGCTGILGSFEVGAGSSSGGDDGSTPDGLGGFEQRIRTANDEVYVNTQNNGLAWTTCAVGTCASPARLLGLKGTHGFTAGANQVYFIDSAARGGSIARCAKTDTACVPTTIVPGDRSSVEALELHQGTLYWFEKGRDDFSEGKLLACSLSLDCSVAGNRKVLVNGLDSPVNLVVDTQGISWLTAKGKLQKCENTACTGGAKDVLPDAIPMARNLVTNQGFYYWLESGNRIVRLAR